MFFKISSILLFNLKSNRICAISQIEADSDGTTVIPPGNFKSSKDVGSPKIDDVQVILICLRTRSIKVDLKIMSAAELIEAFFGSGRKPKVTYVEFSGVKGCMEIIETCSDDPIDVRKNNKKIEDNRNG